MHTGPSPQSWKYLQPADLKRFRNFQFAAKLIVEGYFQGKHRSPYYDFSSEFADYRPYTPGDEVRAIDWRAFARTDRFYIKLFRKETDMNCVMVVDKSNSMAYRGEAAISKLDYASYLAAGLSYLMIRQGDKSGLAICDDRIRNFVPPGGTTQTLQQILINLERNVPGGPTQLATALQVLFGMVKRKGLLIVISDFLDDTAKVFSALNMFAHKGFAVLLFHTLTDDELNLPLAANALFLDPESPLAIAAEPDAIRRAYQQEMQEFVHDMDSKAKARRMHYHLATTADPYYKSLDAFLTARARL
ncbi:MAG: DUF58 domain-containing protein [Fimbriimonadales bacterium]